MGWIEDLWAFRQNPFSIRELQGSEELQKLFVNRESEVRQLVNSLSGTTYGVVYGVSGLRGSGKSTVLNKTLEEMKKRDALVLRVKASGTFSELDFLFKLLSDICEQIETQKVPEKVREEIIRLKTNLLYNEKVAKEGGSEASIRASIKASLLSLLGSEVGSEIKTRSSKKIEMSLKPYSKSSLVREIDQFISFLRKELNPEYIVIGIDETDKCRFEDAEKLLESIKSLLGNSKCHFLFVGTLEFHKNFAQAFKGRMEEATLASLFDGIVLVQRLDDDVMLEIIRRRLNYYSISGKPRNPFGKESLQVILELAGGNVKQMMRLCSESFSYFGDQGKEIKAADLVAYFKGKDYLPDLGANEKEYVEVIRKLGEVSAVSEGFFKKLEKRGIKHRGKKQYRVTLEDLVSKRYLLKKTGTKGQVKYFLSELSKYVS